MVERIIRAEHDAVVTDLFISLTDLYAHRHAGHLKINVREALCHLERGVDVNAVSVTHVDHYGLDLGETLREQRDAPRQRIRRMAGVNEHRKMTAARHLHHRIDRGIVRYERMAQRIHLDAAEALSVDIGLDLFAADVRALERIEVHERDKTARITGGCLCDPLVSRVILRAEHGLLDFVFIHERDQLFGRAVYAGPAAEVTDMCMCIDLFHIAAPLSCA